MTILQTALLVTVISVTIISLVCSFLFYRRSKNRRVTSRWLDLISYSIAAVGVVTLFITIGSFEKRYSSLNVAILLGSKGSHLSFSIARKVSEFCLHDVSIETPIQCNILSQYIGNAYVDWTVPPILRQLPSPENRGEGPIRKIWTEFNVAVSDYNDEVRTFRNDAFASQLSDRELIVFLIFVIAIHLFGISIAMGWVRRYSDLQDDRLRP